MFTSEPKLPHPTQNYAPKVGILLINLGTPSAPTAKAVRPYLAEFLSDRRVVEVPRLVWWAILYGIILPFRSRASAAKYAKIWTDAGSPLLINTQKQTLALRAQLQARNPNTVVSYAMSYGDDSVTKALEEQKKQGVTKIVILPLYPQYAASSTGAALDGVLRACLKIRTMPALRTIRNFHDHPLYIQALAKHVLAYWAQHGRGDKLLLSFHGVPAYTLQKGDPYYCECRKTTRLLGEALQLNADQIVISFQSRLGRAKWLEPYTSDVLANLGKEKLGRLDVICPGFISDCLETLEEIDMEGRETFLHAGGGSFHYIPCLNDSPETTDLLSNLCIENGVNWGI
jgi:ferrochelatase